jgi:hypothetical protein
MTTEADSSNSLLDTIPVMNPVSHLKLDTYYDVSIRGCGKKCPCRTWAQCRQYVDITEQQKRLKYKDNKILEEIHDWYDNIFRIKYEHGELLGNG